MKNLILMRCHVPFKFMQLIDFLYLRKMNVNHLLLCCTILLIPFLSWKKGECSLNPNDKTALSIVHLSSKQFPALPEGVYVNTFVGAIQAERPSSVYTMSIEQFFINGTRQNDLAPELCSR